MFINRLLIYAVKYQYFAGSIGAFNPSARYASLFTLAAQKEPSIKKIMYVQNCPSTGHCLCRAKYC